MSTGTLNSYRLLSPRVASLHLQELFCAMNAAAIGADITGLAQLTRLKRLAMVGAPQLTAPGIVQLSALTALTELNMSRAFISAPDGLACLLNAFPGLLSVSLAGCGCVCYRHACILPCCVTGWPVSQQPARSGWLDMPAAVIGKEQRLASL